MISQICHLTAGDNLANILDVKISLNTFNDLLRTENTVITKRILLEISIIIHWNQSFLKDFIPLDYLTQNI